MDVMEFLRDEFYQWIIGTMIGLIGLFIPFYFYYLERRKKKKENAGLQETSGKNGTYINNLPKQLPLIGRTDELRAISQMLKTHQLITLEGTGGCGKSSLAIEAARENISNFRDGACFIELAPVSRDSKIVPQVVGKALGIKEQASKPPTKVLSEKLAERQVLLIFDNCEHLLEQCAPLIKEIIESSDEVKIIATSRVKINLPFEEVYKVNPLNKPTSDMSLQDLEQVESVRLFLRHGKKKNPRFKLSDNTKEYVVRICNKFEGIPLAIKLAASQLDVYSVEKIAELIESSLSLLRQDDNNILAHHATMTSAIKWSYDLLDKDQKIIFRRLSIFVDKFSSEAAMNVAFESDTDEFSASDKLKKFIESNLLNTSTYKGERRFYLLEPIRQFCLMELKSNSEFNVVASKFYKYFLKVGEKASSNFLGEEQTKWLNAVEEQISNFRSSILRTIELNDFQNALRISSYLWRFWEIRGFYEEGCSTLKSILKKDIQKTEEYFQILNGLGTILYRQGKLDEAENYFKMYFEEEKKRKNPYGLAMAKNDIANVLYRKGKYQDALTSYKEAKNGFLKLKTSSEKEEHNKKRMIAVTTNNIGEQYFNLKKLIEAKKNFQESIKIFEEIGNHWESGFPLIGLAKVYFFQNDFVASKGNYEEALSRRKTVKDTRNIGKCKNGLAKVELKFDNKKQAASYLSEAIASLREVDDLISIRECMLTAILLAASVGESSLAVELASFISLQINTNGEINVPYEESEPKDTIISLRNKMTAEDFEASWKRGAESEHDEIYQNLKIFFNHVY